MGAAIVCTLLAGQSIAIVVQQGQISELQRKAATPGPRGPAGPQGVPGPRGEQGVAGVAGRDGVNGAAVPAAGLGGGKASGMTQTAARAYCTDLAAKAWPDSASSGDSTLDELGRAYSQTQREKSFKQCMSDEGWPQR